MQYGLQYRESFHNEAIRTDSLLLPDHIASQIRLELRFKIARCHSAPKNAADNHRSTTGRDIQRSYLKVPWPDSHSNRS